MLISNFPVVSAGCIYWHEAFQHLLETFVFAEGPPQETIHRTAKWRDIFSRDLQSVCFLAGKWRGHFFPPLLLCLLGRRMYVGAGDKDMGIRSEGRRGAGGMEMVCCYKMCITRAKCLSCLSRKGEGLIVRERVGEWRGGNNAKSASSRKEIEKGEKKSMQVTLSEFATKSRQLRASQARARRDVRKLAFRLNHKWRSLFSLIARLRKFHSVSKECRTYVTRLHLACIIYHNA